MKNRIETLHTRTGISSRICMHGMRNETGACR